VASDAGGSIAKRLRKTRTIARAHKIMGQNYPAISARWPINPADTPSAIFLFFYIPNRP